MGTEPKRVLICGATGYLGGHLVREAKARGHWVRALVRDPERLGEAASSVDEVFVGHATRAETLEGLCDSIEVVISSLGNRTLERRPTVWEVDYGANKNILDRAIEAEVERFVFVSVLHGDRMRHRVPQIEARERLVDELKRGSLPWTIIRPSGFFNDMSEILEMARGGRVWIPKAEGSRFNPIHGADLAAVALDQLEREPGGEVPAGGPDVLTMRQIAELAFAAVGKPPRIHGFPSWTLSAAGKLIGPFNANIASLLLMFTAFEGDSTCEAYGSHHLESFFREQVEAAGDGAVAVRSP